MAQTSSPGKFGGTSAKMNTIQAPHGSDPNQALANMNISDLYKQYAQKSYQQAGGNNHYQTQHTAGPTRQTVTG